MSRLEEIKSHEREIYYLLGSERTRRYFDWLIQQAERVEELEKQLGSEVKRGKIMAYKNVRYKQALEFYANYDNYKLSAEAERADLTEFINVIDMDNGDTARQALEGDSQ